MKQEESNTPGTYRRAIYARSTTLDAHKFYEPAELRRRRKA